MFVYRGIEYDDQNHVFLFIFASIRRIIDKACTFSVFVFYYCFKHSTRELLVVLIFIVLCVFMFVALTLDVEFHL